MDSYRCLYATDYPIMVQSKQHALISSSLHCHTINSTKSNWFCLNSVIGIPRSYAMYICQLKYSKEKIVYSYTHTLLSFLVGHQLYEHTIYVLVCCWILIMILSEAMQSWIEGVCTKNLEGDNFWHGHGSWIQNRGNYVFTQTCCHIWNNETQSL